MLIERSIFRPLGVYLGLKNSVTKHVTLAHDDTIKRAVQAGVKGSYDIAKKTGVEVRKVERWLRR